MPGESRGQRGLAGYSPWGCKELDTTSQGGDQEEQPHAQGVVAARAQEGLEEPSHVEGQEGRQEEIPLIQGKEQRLCFAGAAVKRYPMSKIRETPK